MLPTDFCRTFTHSAKVEKKKEITASIVDRTRASSISAVQDDRSNTIASATDVLDNSNNMGHIRDSELDGQLKAKILALQNADSGSDKDDNPIVTKALKQKELEGLYREYRLADTVDGREAISAQIQSLQQQSPKSCTENRNDASSDSTDNSGSEHELGLDSMFVQDVDSSPACTYSAAPLDLSSALEWIGITPLAALKSLLLKSDPGSRFSFYPISSNRGFCHGICFSHTPTQIEMTPDECVDTLKSSKEFCALKATYTLLGKTFTIQNRLAPIYRDIWAKWETEKDTNEQNLKSSILKQKWEFAKEIKELQGANKHLEEIKLIDSDASIAKKIPLNFTIRLTNENQISSIEWQARKQGKPYAKYLKTRCQLPVFSMHHEIESIFSKNRVVVVSGETGSGKSTQIPHFLLDASLESDTPVKIICTQPRRISAISLAERVSKEVGDVGSLGSKGTLVGYQVRLDNKTSKDTLLTFCTTGILLRRLESDPKLTGISHIVLDEVHERTLESDFLLYTLKNLLRTRNDLRVILMSATANARLFCEYFAGAHPAPSLVVPGKTFPVTESFLEDIVENTGFSLGKKIASQSLAPAPSVAGSYSDRTLKTLELLDQHIINYELVVSLIRHIHETDPAMSDIEGKLGSILVFLPGFAEINILTSMLETAAYSRKKSEQPICWHILQLHSTLSSSAQAQVFKPAPLNHRKIVISTNVAETGITIPDIVYVVDLMRAREMVYDEKREVKRLQEVIIAKANATQRRGRAGRVMPGFAYHFITRTAYDKLDDHKRPEMMRLPLEELCLRSRIILERTDLVSFKEMFNGMPDPPPLKTLENSIKILTILGAIDNNEELTNIGRFLAKLPIEVRLGKTLLYAAVLGCIEPVLSICSYLGVGKSPLDVLKDEKEIAKLRHAQFVDKRSDLLTVLNSINKWQDMKKRRVSKDTLTQYCKINMLNMANLYVIGDSITQLSMILKDLGIDPQNQIFNRNSSNIAMVCSAIGAGFYPKLLIHEPKNISDCSSESYIHVTGRAYAARVHTDSVGHSLHSSFGPGCYAFYEIQSMKSIKSKTRESVWDITRTPLGAILLLAGQTIEINVICNSSSIFLNMSR